MVADNGQDPVSMGGLSSPTANVNGIANFWKGAARKLDIPSAFRAIQHRCSHDAQTRSLIIWHDTTCNDVRSEAEKASLRCEGRLLTSVPLQVPAGTSCARAQHQHHDLLNNDMWTPSFTFRSRAPAYCRQSIVPARVLPLPRVVSASSCIVTSAGNGSDDTCYAVRRLRPGGGAREAG